MSGISQSSENFVPPKTVYKLKGERIKTPKLVALKLNQDGIIKGEIKWQGLINDDEEVYGIATNCPVKDGTNGRFNNEFIFDCENRCGFLVKNSIKFLDINRDGTVKGKSSEYMVEGKGKFSKEEFVSVQINGEIQYGRIINVGYINEILCYEIELNRDSHKHCVIVIENDIKDDEIKDPTQHNVHTYYKKGAFVKINKYVCGVVRKYILHGEVFHYLVDTDTGVFSVRLNDIRYGLDIVTGGKAFLTIADPEEYGIITTLKIGSVVQTLINNNICHGHISWMGFDGDRRFKFGITLEERHGSDNGTYYGQTLFTTKMGYASLAHSSEVAPDGRFPQEEKWRTEPTMKSNFEDNYQIPIYKTIFGDHKGIQGNLNSCYMDTSIFAIFAYNSFLDNILLEKISESENPGTYKLQSILKRNIVYPLRKDNYVSYDKVKEFRDQLQALSPNEKFVMNERDPEELIETLFHLLTPKAFLLRTKRFDDIYEQKCFLTQLFYQDKAKPDMDVLEMLTLTFLESEMLIFKPPKALIIQLPRHGRDLKRFNTVKIHSKIDITPFIVVSQKRCEKCNDLTNDIIWCKECSMRKYKLTYYCKEHEKVCQHAAKKSMVSNEKPFFGKVELELIAILCIERTHYIAYTKTNELSDKWVYFNSMEKLENGEFIPHVRETSLHRYFQNKKGPSNDPFYQSDVDKIENYAFVCFYKNAAMEMYDKDFNAD